MLALGAMVISLFDVDADLYVRTPSAKLVISHVAVGQFCHRFGMNSTKLCAIILGKLYKIQAIAAVHVNELTNVVVTASQLKDLT